MDRELFAAYIGVPVEAIETLIHLSRSEICQNAFYLNLVHQLNYDLLSSTLQDARTTYELYLPEMANYLREIYHLNHRGMTSLTLSSWLLDFLHNPKGLSRLLEIHQNIPLEVLQEGLPAILNILGHMPAPGRREWQKAMALLSLPFFTS
ncbi:MAG: hypothetical protein K8I82_05135 [Anaerolineae bacterium]|nr:hypothetical protein [Anaerolineae bacterium]